MVSDNMWSISGQIVGVNLSSFLQMMEMEQKTCTIKVFSKKKIGRIYFFKGGLIDADTARHKHLDALYDILSWVNIVIEVEKNTSKTHDAINLPLMHVLMEGARCVDEAQEKGRPDPDRELENQPPILNSSRQVITNKNFCLEIGVKLIVELEQPPVSFSSSLIGVEHGKYILLKAPGPLDSFDHDVSMAGDLIVKALYKGTIYAFRSKLMSIISRPSNLMFIEYPDKIEHHELRSHKRFKCSIATQVGIGENERGGVMENISLGGCRCVMETFTNDPDINKGLINNTIAVRCLFPGTSDEISFNCEIKNTQKKSDEIAIGMQFVCLDRNKKADEVIKKYIKMIECFSEDV